MNKTLAQILGSAYAAQVMGQGSVTNVTSQFVQVAKKDASLLAEARAELSRTQNVDPKQCFASAQVAKFLQQALTQVDNANPSP